MTDELAELFSEMAAVRRVSAAISDRILAYFRGNGDETGVRCYTECSFVEHKAVEAFQAMSDQLSGKDEPNFVSLLHGLLPDSGTEIK